MTQSGYFWIHHIIIVIIIYTGINEFCLRAWCFSLLDFRITCITDRINQEFFPPALLNLLLSLPINQLLGGSAWEAVNYLVTQPISELSICHSFSSVLNLLTGLISQLIFKYDSQ
jgi:hypothetical protein